jgi:hypothetical protein
MRGVPVFLFQKFVISSEARNLAFATMRFLTAFGMTSER